MLVEDLVEHLPKGGDVYITFDIDALDPAIAPGTGTPEPGGFSYYEAKEILLAVGARCNVLGMDLVEVAPQYDGPGPGHRSARRPADTRHRGRRLPAAGRARLSARRRGAPRAHGGDGRAATPRPARSARPRR